MITALALPYVLGITHCLETDHILAVATLNNDQENTTKSLILKGATWGVGHSIPVIICGLTYVLFKFFLLAQVPINLEVPVGCLLIGVGIYKLVSYKQEQNESLKKHYLLIGIVHGLAGSAGIILVHFANESNIFFQSAYLFLFCIGAIIGMGSVNVIISKISSVFNRIQLLQLITPIISIIYGGIMIYNYV